MKIRKGDIFVDPYCVHVMIVFFTCKEFALIEVDPDPPDMFFDFDKIGNVEETGKIEFEPDMGFFDSCIKIGRL